MPVRIRLPILLALGLALGVAAGVLRTADAQTQTGPQRGESPPGGRGTRGSGLWRHLRDRLMGRDGPAALREAMLLPDGGAAREVMEGLAGRSGDEVTTARAALWMGHYHYGAGDAETALAWFERARDAGGGPAERTESDFWVAQCRNLLGRAQEGEPGDQGPGVAAVLSRVARLDGELRVGRVQSALRGYFELEGDARRAGCLGPLLYRFGLAAASGAGGGELGWATVRAWAPECAVSPEYALVQVMQPPPASAADSQTARGSDAIATPFVEMPGAPPAEPVSNAGVTGADRGSAEDGPSAPGEGVTGAAEARIATPDRGGAFTVQLGSFHDVERATREARRLEGLGLPVRVEVEEVDGAMWHRVRLGRYRSREEAEESALARCTGLEWRIVRVGP